MSNPAFGPLPEPAGELASEEINEAYKVVELALQDIRDENIEPGSVFTRHIVTGDSSLAAAPFKEIHSRAQAANWFTAGPLAADFEIIGSAATIVAPGVAMDPIDTRDAVAVVVMATIPCRVNNVALPAGPGAGTVFVEANIRANIGPGLANQAVCGAQGVSSTEPGAVVEDEAFNVQMVGAFRPREDEHQVSLWLNATTTENLELHKGASPVGETSLIAWVIRG